jgi:phospholipid transport system substrate-binding protein
MKIFINLFLLLLLFCGKAFAQNDHIKLFVENIGNEIVKVANNKTLKDAQKKSAIIKIIDQNIDSQWISRFVLGSHYKTIDEAKKAKFAELYRQFMIETYGPKFNSYNGKSFVVNKIEDQKNFFLAKANFYPQGTNNPISIDFRIKEKNQKLFVVDFIAEGVSLLETQRSEFDSAITNLGIDKFLNDLESKTQQLKKANKL